MGHGKYEFIYSFTHVITFYGTLRQAHERNCDSYYLKEKEINSESRQFDNFLRGRTLDSVFDDAKLFNSMIVGLTRQNLSDQTT